MRSHWMLLLVLVCTQIACSGAPSDHSSASPSATSIPSSATTSPAPQSMVESSLAVEDPVFGFSMRALALERRVEMLQWQSDAQGAYTTQWSVAHVDSSGFDPKHANPAELPFNGERWWTRDARLDGQPVSPNLLAALDAWQTYAPDLRQLPPNLAASVQPDGEWLSTAQDPQHPVVGDVRLRWRILEHAVPPPGIALRAGRWELPAEIAAAVPPPAFAPVAPSTVRRWMQRTFGGHLKLLAIIGVALAALLLLWRHRR